MTTQRNRFVRTKRQAYERKLLHPIANWIGRPSLAALEKVGLGPFLLTATGRLGFGSDPWPGYWNDFQPSAGDVIVGSYMKSGTNWVLQIAHQILWHGRGEFDHIHDVVPWPDAPISKYAIDIDDDSISSQCPEGQRVIKPHSPWRAIPQSRDARYILVVRDPKDVLVSSYHFLKGAIAGPLMPRLATWHQAFLSEHFPPGRWAEHAAGYWSARSNSNVYFVSFKELMSDLRSIVAEIAQFLDVSLSHDELELVCERSTFKSMKRDGKKFAPGIVTPLSELTTPMLRSGKQGASGSLLTNEQQIRIDETMLTALAELGSNFDWARTCDSPHQQS